MCILMVLYGICEIRLYRDYKGIDERLRNKEVEQNQIIFGPPSVAGFD